MGRQFEHEGVKIEHIKFDFDRINRWPWPETSARLQRDRESSRVRLVQTIHTGSSSQQSGFPDKYQRHKTVFIMEQQESLLFHIMWFSKNEIEKFELTILFIGSLVIIFIKANLGDSVTIPLHYSDSSKKSKTILYENNFLWIFLTSIQKTHTIL